MRARVHNDNPNVDWKESFKGEMIEIPSGKHIEMEFYEAHEFKGQYFPIKVLADETQDPKSFKTIRVEKIVANLEDGELENVQTVFPCNSCKKAFNSEEALLKHSTAQHSDQFVTDAMAEEANPKKRGRPPIKKSV